MTPKTFLVIVGLLALCGSAAAAADDPLAWPATPPETRPWSYWWWLGSGVDPGNLTRELERYRAAGWGGVHIIPIYGAKGYESRYIEYLSPKWLEMMSHAVSEGRRLDLGVDMTTGTGWCFGGPNISDQHASAMVMTKTIDVASGATLTDRFPRESVQALVAVSASGQALDLTSRIAADGSVPWTAEGGPWRVYAVSQRPTTRVKRAAPGGEGYMLNPFYGAALQTYLERFTKAFAAHKGPRPRAMYHDSFEYGVNWSPNLLAEFEKRRGYRLQSEFAALFGGVGGDRAARVKSDYRETLAEMLHEDFTRPWVEWCHRLGFVTRDQAHGSPGNLLDLYAENDIPETEMFHLDRSTIISKFASSAAHVAGRKLVASESGTWLREHFTERLADVKDLLDQLYVAGVNHVIYHGTCFSPDDAPWPGWLFYASTQMNPRSAIWRDAPALSAYIARCQSLLQAGRPDNDILIYWPIYDVWHNPEGMTQNFTVHGRNWVEAQVFGKLTHSLLDRGYSFDFVSDRQLSQATAARGEVRLPGGAYHILLVPAVSHMPVATMERLLALARSGATVIFQDRLPTDVPGLKDLEARRAQLGKLVESVNSRQAAGGKILVGDVEAHLKAAGARREAMVGQGGLQYIRRATTSGSFYFIANRGSKAVEGWIPLASSALSAVLLDPMTGRTGVAAARGGPARLEVFLQLGAGESIFVRTTTRRLRGQRWIYWKPGAASVPVEGTWDVRFLEGGPELPQPLRMSQLVSWTEAAGEVGQRFAGAALYSLRFDAPAQAAAAWLLELGKVCESARVRLNGRPLGTLFAPPFQIVLEGLQPKGNLLEIEVTNVSANRIRDLDRRKAPWKVFHDINIVNTQYRPFDASDWPLRDSGLLGPVALRPLSKLEP